MLFSFLLLSEKLSWQTLAAAALLITSIGLIRRGRHTHRHAHEETTHIHMHRHDDMHQTHTHEGAPASPMHSHEHRHEALECEHAHVSDLHRKHEHPGIKKE
jgi:ABC-type nickel/cobalt efflux system permease component RcnA